MNLEESDKYLEDQQKNEKKKKVVLMSIIFCAILVALLVILIIYIQYQDSLKLKMYIDGRQVPISSGLLAQEGEVQYINIKSVAELLGYTYTKGEYKKYNEDVNSCYVKNNFEVVAMTAESDIFIKYAELVPDSADLTAEGPFGMAITAESENGHSSIFNISKPVKLINNQLYLPFEYLRDVYNVMVDTNTPNRIRIYTLPTLFRNATALAAKLEYSTISGIYENIKAIPYGLVVVGNNGIFGVIDSYGQGKEILSVKYESLRFEQNSQEFFMRAEKTVGLLDREGNTIIQPRDYDNISIFDGLEQLYLVEKDKKFGILNREGEIVLHPDYDSIGFENIEAFEKFKEKSTDTRNILFDKCIVVELDDAYGLYDLKGNELLKPVYEGFGCISEETSEDSVFTIPKEVGVEGLVINFNGLYAVYDIEKEEIVVPAVYSKIYSITKAGETNYYAEFGDSPFNIKDIIKSIKAEESNSSNNQSEEGNEEELEENTHETENISETEE